MIFSRLERHSTKNARAKSFLPPVACAREGEFDASPPNTSILSRRRLSLGTGETPTSWTIARLGHSIPHSPLGSHRRSHLPAKSHTMATQAAVMSAKATQVRTAPRARNPVTRFPASFLSLAWLFHGTPTKKPSVKDPRACVARGNPRTPRPTDRRTSRTLRARPTVAFPRSSVAHPPRRGFRCELWIMPRRVPSGRRAPLRFFEHSETQTVF